MYNFFPSRLRQALQEANITQSELSKITGLPKSGISQYLSGIYEPKQKAIYLIAKALNVSEAFLMGLDEHLSTHTQELIKKYTALNNEGQDKINDYIDDLSMNPRYLKTSTSPAYTEKEKPVDIKTPYRPLIAARSGGVKEMTDEQLADFELFLKHKQKGK